MKVLRVPRRSVAAAPKNSIFLPPSLVMKMTRPGPRNPKSLAGGCHVLFLGLKPVPMGEWRRFRFLPFIFILTEERRRKAFILL